jgi:hypothetical protein
LRPAGGRLLQVVGAGNDYPHQADIRRSSRISLTTTLLRQVWRSHCLRRVSSLAQDAASKDTSVGKAVAEPEEADADPHERSCDTSTFSKHMSHLGHRTLSRVYYPLGVGVGSKGLARDRWPLFACARAEAFPTQACAVQTTATFKLTRPNASPTVTFGNRVPNCWAACGHSHDQPFLFHPQYSHQSDAPRRQLTPRNSALKRSPRRSYRRLGFWERLGQVSMSAPR